MTLAMASYKGTMPNRDYTPSSGNVFADLALPRPDDLLAKAELAAKIIQEIERRRLTQRQAAGALGVDQPKVSALKQGRLSGFSIERLIRFLLFLGRDIEITVKEKPRSRSAARLRVA
jgi:predicted XRE-type DNA-binding protein